MDVNMMKILLICHDIPSMTVGATLPIYHLIKNLGKRYSIDLISFNSKKYDIDSLKEFLNNYYFIDIPEYLDFKSQFLYTVKNMISFDNLSTRSFLNYYYTTDMSKLIKEKFNDDYDVVITDMPMAFYAKNINKPKIVYAFDAVSDYNYKMYKKADSIASKLYWFFNYCKIHRYEKVYNKFDSCIVVNEKDKLLLEQDIKIPISVIPNGVDTNYFKNNGSDDEKIVFLGDMSTPPNNDAVRYFVKNIYPKILEDYEIPFYVVGRNPSYYIKSLADEKHITVTGSVDDVRTFLTKDSIFITPMISGTGIKNKILEAMSMELPVVSTSIGISGISAKDNEEFLLADNEQEFKNQILRLTNDNDLKKSIGKKARLFVETNYSWITSMDSLDEIIKIITKNN